MPLKEHVSPLTKHIPLRRCAACGGSAAKRSLMRLVRTAGGQVKLDPKGRLPGRGTYLCFKPGCWERVAPASKAASAPTSKGGRDQDFLGHALKIGLTPEQRQGLLDDFRKLALEATQSQKVTA